MNARFSKLIPVAAISALTLLSGSALADSGYLSVTFGDQGVASYSNHYGNPPRRHGYDRGHDQFSSFVDVRQDRQREWIRKGVRSGELTPWEARELMREQHEIAALEQRFLADGYLDRHERQRLDKELDEAGRNIRIEKHDDDDRGDYRQPRGQWR